MVNILCYKSKTLANGEHPLMIRVCKDGKKKYISLGVSVLPQYWDFEKNKPKRNCPNKLQIEKIIAEKNQQYADQIIEFKTENKSFTASSLINSVQKPVIHRTVGDMFLSQIGLLKAEKRTGYALSHLEVYNSLMKFNGNLDIYFSDIDITWLKRYESWLRSSGIAENTIGRRLRTLRVVFNLAIEQNLVKAEYYA